MTELNNPMDYLNHFWPDIDNRHITYEPQMKGSEREYWRREQSTHDGTLWYTIELFERLLMPLMNRESYYKPTFEKGMIVREIKYTIGKIRHMTLFGKVELPCGVFDGQRERLVMPVRCTYVKGASDE